MKRSVSIAKCDWSSVSISRSKRFGVNNPRSRDERTRSAVSIGLAPLSPQDLSNHPRETLPILGFPRKLPTSRFRDGIKPRFPVVFRCAPLRSNPPFLHEAQQGRIDGALIQPEKLLAQLLDSTSDAVAVQRPQNVKRLEHHQIKRSLKDFGFKLSHRGSYANRKGRYHFSFAMSIGEAAS